MLLNIFQNQLFKHNTLLFISCLCLSIGLFFSKAVISISAASIFFCGIINLKMPLKTHILQWLFPILYLLLLLSFFYTDDIQNWKILVVQDAPMLFVSLGFLLSKPLNNTQVKYILWLFALLSVIIVSLTAMQVIWNYQAWAKAFSLSKNIASVTNIPHNRFGFLCVIGFVILVDLYQKEHQKAGKIICLIGSILLFLTVHIIAYRFAIALIYIVLFTTVLIRIKHPKNIFFRTGLFGTFFFLIAWLCMILSPTLKARFNDTIEDLIVVTQNKNANNFSISQRWAALQCATEVVKQKPLIGTGPADLKNAMQKQYNTYSYWLIPQNRIFIHNQYLYTAAGLGIPLAIIFFTGLLLIIILKHNFIFSISTFTLLAHMLIENSLQMQVILLTVLLLNGIFPFKEKQETKVILN